MIESSVTRAIKRSNLSLLVIGIVLIALVVAGFLISYRYMYNFLLGPFDVTPAQLQSYTSAEEPLQYWVKVPALRSYDTGIQYFETKDGVESVKHSYHALELGEKLLLYTVPGDKDGNIESEVLGVGYLDKLSSEEKTEVIDATEAQSADLAGVFLPYKLNGASFRSEGLILVIVGVIVGLIGLVMLVIAILRMSKPENHPIFRALGRHGDPQSTANAIEMELQQPHDVINKNLHLLKNWLVYSPAGKFDAIRYDDLMWLYQHVQTQRYYGIPVSRTRSIMLHDNKGSKAQVMFGRKEEPVLEAMDQITDHAPWAVVGYDNNIDKGWRKDNANFVASVEAHREELKKGAAAYPGQEYNIPQEPPEA